MNKRFAYHVGEFGSNFEMEGEVKHLEGRVLIRPTPPRTATKGSLKGRQLHTPSRQSEI